MIYSKLLVALLLVPASACASAIPEWIYVAGGDMSNVSYAKPSSIVKHGNKVTMWLMEDFKNARSLVELKYSSMRTQDEYDCKEEQSRTISGIFYSGKMASGDVVYSYNEPNGEWFPVAQDSIGRLMFNLACTSNQQVN